MQDDYEILSKMKRTLTVILFFIAGYLALSTAYYYHEKHLFDPYLQMRPVAFNETAEKTKNTFRILCLGGSATLCDGLTQDRRYPYLLNKILQKHYPGVKIEVLNAGMQWYTSKHSLINYVTYYRRFEPDLVVVMDGINDLYRSFSPGDWAVGKYNDLWSHFYGPSIRGAKPPTFEYHLLWRLSRFIEKRFPDLNLREKLSLDKGINYPVEKYVSLGMFEKYLSTLAKYVKSDKSDILIVSQPTLYKDSMDSSELKALWMGKTFCSAKQGFLRTEYASHGSLCEAMKSFNRAAEKVARSENAYFADAADRVPKNLRNFEDDCHYTEGGSELLAEVVAETIIKKELVEKRLKINDSP
jgi:lysophospholipase L1-like esterase